SLTAMTIFSSEPVTVGATPSMVTFMESSRFDGYERSHPLILMFWPISVFDGFSIPSMTIAYVQLGVSISLASCRLFASSNVYPPLAGKFMTKVDLTWVCPETRSVEGVMAMFPTAIAVTTPCMNMHKRARINTHFQ